MTRATLLRLLAHPTALNGADVRALEELAEAFPYCQTAHLLLAKAAHDHGSMLAGQRLRRAATYATDRTLLRQLIEAAPVEETLAPAAAEAAASEAVAATTSFAAAGRMVAPPAAVPTPPAAPTTPLLLEDKPAQEIGPAPVAPPLAAPQPPPAPPASEAAAAPAPPAEAAAPTPTFAPTDSELVTAGAIDTPVAPAPASAPEAALPDAPSAEAVVVPGTPTPASELLLVAPATEAMPVADAELASSELPASEEVEPASIEAAAPNTLAQPSVPREAELIGPEQAASAEAATAAETDELPAQAPPIRPPAEAEAARQEFGLVAASPADVMAYQLPELELAITIPLTPANATPRLPAFSGVPDVAYAPGEGSRYGFCLVPVAAETDAAVPLVPAAKLPPAGEFFAPDALLLAYLAEPPELPTSSTTDLINSFLQRSSGATRRRGVPTPASPQADLSVRTTRATPDLASESLAKILARQGKTEQAIAVYERLMVKIPEKSTIFAAEIEALRPSA